MTSRVPVGIAGTGSYVPERVVKNEFFENIVDTTDEWIVQRTGIRERRFAAEGEFNSDMAIEAGKRALEDAGLEPKDLDLILLGTLTPDHLLPSTSALIQDRMGAVNAGAFDVNAACTGFLTVMSTAEAFIAAGRAKRVLAIGAERLSSFINFEDRGSCILFGDGAGAAVLSPLEECGQGEVLRTSLGADGSGYEFIHMRGGGSKMPPTSATVAERQHFIEVRGRDVFRFAVARMADLVAEMMEGQDMSELGLIVPHQVNKRIIDAALERVGVGHERVIVNIQNYGNTSSATVPIALDEARRTGRLEKGKLVVLAAFGAGLTWGGALLRW